MAKYAYLCSTMLKKPYKILVVDDNQGVLRTLKLVLGKIFTSVVTVADPTLIPALLQPGDVDAVLLDMNFGSCQLDGEEGLFWLNRISQKEHSPAVVLITAFGDIDLAVRCLQQGAEDFITKPWENEVLIQKLETAIEKHRLRQDTASLVAQAGTLQHSLQADSQLSLEELEKKHILQVLEQEGGNVVNTAVRLGISRQTLYNRLKKYGIVI